jgi:hypothetical protein
MEMMLQIMDMVLESDSHSDILQAQQQLVHAALDMQCAKTTHTTTITL